MEDYCDGLQYKQHPLFSIEPHSLQIMLYYDELEICNPLGLGGVLGITLVSTPLRLWRALKNIGKHVF